MEPIDQFNFSLFKPRNLHGRKNRNVILSMLLIWAVAVFGFQILLRVIQKPVPEKALSMFESTWPKAVGGSMTADESRTFITSLVLVKGKNTVKPADQGILDDAISSSFFGILQETDKAGISSRITELNSLKAKLSAARDQAYLDIKSQIDRISSELIEISGSYTGFKQGSLESKLLISSLKEKYTGSLSAETFGALPAIMKLYLTHNQSVLTDKTFLGFPFHYFYTAVFLLILFVILCIVYNVLIEWRLNKEGIVE